MKAGRGLAYVAVAGLAVGGGIWLAPKQVETPQPMSAPEAAPIAAAEAQEPPAAPEAMTQPNPEVEALQARIAEATLEVAALDTAVTERTAELDEIEALIAARQGELAGLEAALAEHGVALQQIMTALEDRDYATLTHLGERIAAGSEPEVPTPELVAATPGDDKETTGFGRYDADIAKIQEVIHEARVKANPDAIDTNDSLLMEIQFESGSATLTIGGQTRAMAAAQVMSEMDLDVIRIQAHTDTVGAADANAALARARAEAVARVFTEAGLPADAIEIAALGEAPDTLPVVTPDGTAEPLNRSVGIYPVSLTN
ncbi:OmpA family protein [Rhodobacteraceae bacterium DSL-40]|uniref:OmpA family protein n=1 Tax=Amaricoccus sp. B4 TaxID=3368557 RepID=UPI0013A6B569